MSLRILSPSMGGGALPPVVVAGSNEARIDAILDLYTVPARFAAVEYPSDPTTTNSVAVSNQTELNNALVSGNEITVNAGTYTSLSINGVDDIDIIFSDIAQTVSGGLTIQNASRIRITGGNFTGAGHTAFIQDGASHVLLDDVHITNGSHYSADSVGPTHLAVINSTIRSPGAHYGNLIGNGAGAAHIIFANVDNHSESSNSAIRWTTASSAIIAGSRISTVGHRSFRLHSHFGPSDLILLTGNQMEHTTTDNIWIGPEVGSSHSNAITRLELRGNKIYIPNNATVAVQFDSSAGGGIDDVIVNDNEIYSPTSQITNNQPTNYSASGNTFSAYTTPPTFTGGATR